MIAAIADIASWICIAAGSLALLTGGIGVLRMPDVYTRMHAASITDTMGVGLFILGMILQSGDLLIAVKLCLILVFIYFTSPTSTFALAHAALTGGVTPVLAGDVDEDRGEDAQRQEESS
jgi:multicomponent Na+:H+ antiporter subunit G